MDTEYFASVAREFQRLLHDAHHQRVPGQQWGAGGRFMAAASVTTSEYGVGPIGMIGADDKREHPDWWQLVVRHPMQPSVNDKPDAPALPPHHADPHVDTWMHQGRDWHFEGNAEAARRDLDAIVASQFDFRDCWTREGDRSGRFEDEAA